MTRKIDSGADGAVSRLAAAEEVVQAAVQLLSFDWACRLDDSQVSDDAKESAYRLGSAVYNYDRVVAALPAVKTYLCERCERESPSAEWGPGWITCPICGFVARTVFEKANHIREPRGLP